jgi:hypothetical protein
MKKHFAFIILIATLSAQIKFNKEFDFWIGEWDTEMATIQNWSNVRTGVDHIQYELEGRLIREVFKKNGKKEFQQGYLTYLVRDQKWIHTIYDVNWGTYSFEGVFKDGKITLVSNDTRPGYRRETFHNITKDSFDYFWEESPDGKNWTVTWKVKYKRRK